MHTIGLAEEAFACSQEERHPAGPASVHDQRSVRDLARDRRFMEQRLTTNIRLKRLRTAVQIPSTSRIPEIVNKTRVLEGPEKPPLHGREFHGMGALG